MNSQKKASKSYLPRLLEMKQIFNSCFLHGCVRKFNLKAMIMWLSPHTLSATSDQMEWVSVVSACRSARLSCWDGSRCTCWPGCECSPPLWRPALGWSHHSSTAGHTASSLAGNPLAVNYTKITHVWQCVESCDLFSIYLLLISNKICINWLIY